MFDLAEYVASILWVAVHLIPDDVWNAWDVNTRAGIMAALRPVGTGGLRRNLLLA